MAYVEFFYIFVSTVMNLDYMKLKFSVLSNSHVTVCFIFSETEVETVFR